MAKSRPLVGGYLERVSVKAFENYRKEITDLVQSEHGVYALYKNDRLYYVGLAVDLRRRVNQHLKDKHAGRWNRFSLYLVRKVDHIKEIESLLLRIADPTGNKMGGRLRRAKNLQKRLRRMMMQRHRDELNEVFAKKGKPAKLKPTRKRTPRAKKKARALDGFFACRTRLYATYKGKQYIATIGKIGRIRFNGEYYDSPSGAAQAVRNRPTNGWRFWCAREDGELIPLSELRARR